MAAFREWAALLLGASGALGWASLFGLRTFCSLRAPRLSDQRDPPPQRWPALDIVMPARDEAATIGPALRSLLAQDYPDLHVIAVDDRSSDDTGAILDALAREHPSLEVLHMVELPAGWLGKVHALAQRLERARGELVLFCDADVHFAPGALRHLVAVAEAHGLEHLTALPRLRATGPLQGALMAAFADGYVERARGQRGVVLTRGPAFGFGAFNLVRRAALARSEGLAWLRMDVLDDLALGELMRRVGPGAASSWPRTPWRWSGTPRSGRRCAASRRTPSAASPATAWAALFSPRSGARCCSAPRRCSCSRGCCRPGRSSPAPHSHSCAAPRPVPCAMAGVSSTASWCHWCSWPCRSAWWRRP